MNEPEQKLVVEPKPTNKRIVAIALAIEAVALVTLFAYWIYLRLWLSRSLGFAAQILSVVGIVIALGLASWAAWRIGRRHHFRFTIRTMMIAVSIMGLLLALLLSRVQRTLEFQSRVVAYQQAQAIILAHDGDRITSQPSGAPLKSTWTLEESVTPVDGFLHQVFFASQQFTDNDLENLAQHPNLEVVGFRNCGFSKAGFLNLSKLKTCTSIDLRFQTIDDQWVREFKSFRPDCQIQR